MFVVVSATWEPKTTQTTGKVRVEEAQEREEEREQQNQNNKKWHSNNSNQQHLPTYTCLLMYSFLAVCGLCSCSSDRYRTTCKNCAFLQNFLMSSCLMESAGLPILERIVFTREATASTSREALSEYLSICVWIRIK